MWRWTTGRYHIIVLFQNKSHPFIHFLDEEKINKPQLLFVTRHEIIRFPANFADIPDAQIVKNKYLVSNRTLLVAVEMDAKAEMMFYSDYGKREIYRVRLFSGRSIKTVVGGVGSAEGNYVL